MSQRIRSPRQLVVLAILGVVGVLGLYRTRPAVSQPPRMPFSNSVEQRSEMIKELRQIRQLLEEQNRLLRTWASRDRGARKSSERNGASARRGR